MRFDPRNRKGKCEIQKSLLSDHNAFGLYQLTKGTLLLARMRLCKPIETGLHLNALILAYRQHMHSLSLSRARKNQDMERKKWNEITISHVGRYVTAKMTIPALAPYQNLPARPAVISETTRLAYTSGSILGAPS